MQVAVEFVQIGDYEISEGFGSSTQLMQRDGDESLNVMLAKMAAELQCVPPVSRQEQKLEGLRTSIGSPVSCRSMDENTLGLDALRTYHGWLFYFGGETPEQVTDFWCFL